MIANIARRVLIACVNWSADGSTSELERLRVLRYDAIRLPATDHTRQVIETLDQLIEIEMANGQRMEQRKAAIMAGAL